MEKEIFDELKEEDLEVYGLDFNDEEEIESDDSHLEFPFEDYYDENEEIPEDGEDFADGVYVDPDYDYEMFLADAEQQ